MVKSDFKQGARAYARYSSLVIQMIVVILIGVFGGNKLDEIFSFSFPFLTLILTLLAAAFAMYLLINEILKDSKKKD